VPVQKAVPSTRANLSATLPASQLSTSVAASSRMRCDALGIAYISNASMRHLPTCGVLESEREPSSDTQPAEASSLSTRPSMSFVLMVCTDASWRMIDCSYTFATTRPCVECGRK
jgi:hypothetical protein